MMPMRILFITHAFNSLTQRLWIELTAAGHELSLEFDINDAVTLQAVELFRPDLILAPFLKRPLPKCLWSRIVCLIVHPGIRGDRGPSALDWAILNGQQRGGVTVLQANQEMDAGDIWAAVEFPLRETSKSSLYRNEVTEAAVEAVLIAVARIAGGSHRPQPLDYTDPTIRGRWRPLMKQVDRAIHWQQDDSASVLRKIRSADGFPGLRDKLAGRYCYLYDASPEEQLTGEPGRIIGRHGGAICRATTDGAVWIGQLRDSASAHPFKLPATQVLSNQLDGIPQCTPSGPREISYRQQGDVGYLHFTFYNGAMGTGACQRLLEAFRQARRQKTRVILLMGGPDFWSNGMNLNTIEAAKSPADESWRNINAINDLAQDIITTDSHYVVAVLQGNAGAGGLFLALAADEVWARGGVVLNPHYKDMGNLYGSEYWSYRLPKRVGLEQAARMLQRRLPMGTDEARDCGLIDRSFGSTVEDFCRRAEDHARKLAASPGWERRMRTKSGQRRIDQAIKPLESYRIEELERMKLNFYGFDPSYHVARYNFVYKVPKSRTPITLARHRDQRVVITEGPNSGASQGSSNLQSGRRNKTCG